MKLTDDRGISLTEMLVVTILMGLVLAVAYAGIQFAYGATATAETQSRFAREVTVPMNIMDHAFSQRVPQAGWTMQSYTATLRMPADYSPGKVLEYEFTANSNGTLVQNVFQISGTTKTLVRTTTWSTTNSNVASNLPLFSYYNGSVPATNVALVNNVVLKVATEQNGREFVDSRRVFFRNR
jgi:prepilin-type N-terminal cleavage/methylation domain-containing protein